MTPPATEQPPPPHSRSARYAAALWQDHGWVREFWLNNFHRIDAQAFRSGQPSPRHLRHYIPRYGIRSVVNLRGEEPGNPMLALARETCAELGITLHTLKLHSRALPQPETLHAVYALLPQLEYPTWFHCKSGADRAGLMATLYLHWMRGVALEQTHQLRLWPYFHYRYAKTGLLDYFFAAYLADQRTHPCTLLEWIDSRYDRDTLRQHFKPTPVFDALLDRLLRRE